MATDGVAGLIVNSADSVSSELSLDLFVGVLYCFDIQGERKVILSSVT